MKFTLTFKTPDVVDDVLKEDHETNCGKEEHNGEHDPKCDDCVALEEICCDNNSKFLKCAEKFIQNGESISIEFDAISKTAKVLKVKRMGEVISMLDRIKERKTQCECHKFFDTDICKETVPLSETVVIQIPGSLTTIRVCKNCAEAIAPFETYHF